MLCLASLLIAIEYMEKLKHWDQAEKLADSVRFTNLFLKLVTDHISRI